MITRLTFAIRGMLIATLLFEPSLLFAQAQTWDVKISGSSRFKVLSDFNGEAVLDRETGLVWEQTPEPGAGSWSFIDDECFAHFTGGRLGWRPPTLEEILSLMDPLQNFTGKLPLGHPFNLGDERVSRQFWTMTSAVVQPPDNTFAYVANFEPGGSFFADNKISVTHRFWCVRGGHGYDGNNVK
jgi:Protein of unknown function (DUF1566)